MFWLLLGIVLFFLASGLLWGILNSIAHPRKHAGTLVFLIVSGAFIYWLLTNPPY